ncbi:MarR family winged helix-turn-helix transcriptional regulator [Nocardia tengchongensis]|uniref:MarR family winged helix-turn-helix transcriptional regulator n=1 Tax=Nocardia tengchongensis TaxID=2055889 RepID=UPI00368C4ADA
MSSDMEKVLAELGEVVQAYQSSVDDYDRENARLLGVNESDLRCLELLLTVGEQSPRQLSAELALTSGSVTAMLGRLEKLDLLVRTPHPIDRRKVVVRLTDAAHKRIYAQVSPLIDDGAATIGVKYDVAQLELVIDFLRTNTAIQERHTERMRATHRGAAQSCAGADQPGTGGDVQAHP